MPDPVGFDDALYAMLQADADLLARVSTRCYPDRAPDDVGAQEYIVFTLISGESDQDHDSAESITRQRWQVTCYAADAAAAKVLSKLVRAAVHGKTGTYGGVRVDYANAFDGPSDFTAGNKKLERIVEIDTMFAEPA